MKNRNLIIIIAALVLIIGLLGFFVAKFIQERKGRKDFESKYTNLLAARTDTTSNIRWVEIDTANLIKHYLAAQPKKKFTPCPVCDTTKPGVVTIYRDTCMDIFQPLETVVDTFDRPDLFLLYTIQSWGPLESFQVNRYKAKLIETTINYVYPDTVLVPVPDNRSRVGGYAGVIANNFREFPGLEAGLWLEYRNVWGIEAGAMLVDKKFYGSLKGRFSFGNIGHVRK